MAPSKDDVFQMVAALMTVMGSIERARQQGDASTLAALQIIAARGPVRPSDIALDLGVHQSTITRQVRTLEAAGHVTVAADPDDRRSCFIALTDAGRDEVARLTEIGLSRFMLFVADWDADEVRTLGRLLMKLENSKADLNTREQRPDGRRWQKRA
jgi:DNA-binding MarR family transcriptional regulator